MNTPKPSHDQHMLDRKHHYMCWSCARKHYGDEQIFHIVAGRERTLDHCCWCGELHRSGMYWNSGPVGRICGGSGGAHPVLSSVAGSHPVMLELSNHTYPTRIVDEE